MPERTTADTLAARFARTDPRRGTAFRDVARDAIAYARWLEAERYGFAKALNDERTASAELQENYEKAAADADACTKVSVNLRHQVEVAERERIRWRREAEALTARMVAAAQARDAQRSRAEVAERERDALRTEVSEALTSARLRVRERDEAREELAACEASKADEERANAGLAKALNEARAEVERLRAALRQARANLGGRHTDVGPFTGHGNLSCACPRCVIDRALGDG